MIGRRDLITMGAALAAVAAAGLLTYGRAPQVLTFVMAAVALAAIASTIGEATDHVGAHLSPAATGVLQSAVGNLPELFVAVFALKAGLITVVQTSLIGSILTNSLLVLGAAFIAGGARHGVLTFDAAAPRMIATLLLLAVAALILPTLANFAHIPAADHEPALAVVCALVLLAVFALSVRAMLAGGARAVRKPQEMEGVWPLPMAVAVLAGAGIAAAVVSDWFVDALQPAIATLGISQAFAGLVIVSIAGNAVENVVGIRLAARNQGDLAVSVVLNSSLQVAVALIPVLVLVSFAMGGTPFTLVVPPMLAAALAITAVIGLVVTADGQADVVDGAALVGLYIIVAAIFWWG